MKVTIQRSRPTKHGTFGSVSVNGQSRFVTIELPDKDNKPNISCIPPGTYLCKRTHSPTHGETFEVLDVPGRTHILFHVANTIDDILGCIGLGLQFGVLPRSRTAVLSSRKANERFMKLLEGHDYFALEVLSGS